MCRRVHLLVYYLLTFSLYQAAFHTGGLFLCAIRSEHGRSPSLPQAAAPSTTGGCINSPVSIDRTGGASRCSPSQCWQLSLPAEGRHQHGRRETRPRLHQLASQTCISASLTDFSSDKYKLSEVMAHSFLACFMQPDSPLPRLPTPTHPDQRPMSFSRNSQFHRRGRYRLHPQTTRKWHQKGRK